MSSEVAIKVESLSKCYQIYDKPRDRLLQMFARRGKQYFREFWALKGVSFEIRKGETVGVVGRNGSGKSTLLQMICGTLNPSAGSIRTNGRIAALLELGSGFNPEFTGRENVYMYATVLGLSRAETENRFEAILAFAEIGDFIDQPIKSYSSGMVVRLAFAVAINVDPQILVVDEALSVGDELFQRKCFARINAIKASGATILFVSHSGSAVVELCDRAILLDAGELLTSGFPKDIVGKYQKLLYAPTEKRASFREEIHTTGQAELQKTRGFTEKKLSKDETETLEAEVFFDPGLQPTSTLVYESNGVRIDSAKIYDSSGKRVNCLRRGNIYHYSYNAYFFESAAAVRFGMLIKTVTGLELGGAASAPSTSHGIPYVASGTRVNIAFQFVCNLNPGTYFLNAGVTGVQQEEEIYLHRVLDIAMFRVMPCVHDTATGLIYFNCSATENLTTAVGNKL